MDGREFMGHRVRVEVSRPKPVYGAGQGPADRYPGAGGGRDALPDRLASVFADADDYADALVSDDDDGGAGEGGSRKRARHSNGGSDDDDGDGDAHDDGDDDDDVLGAAMGGDDDDDGDDVEERGHRPFRGKRGGGTQRGRGGHRPPQRASHPKGAGNKARGGFAPRGQRRGGRGRGGQR